MLELDFTNSRNEKQTRTTKVRHGEKEAQREVKSKFCHVLTAEDAKQFAASLNKPPSPTPYALKVAASYRRRVVNAD